MSAVRVIFECPACGHWYGEREGLWSKAHHCPRCVRANVAKKPKGAQGFTTGADVRTAPMMFPVEVVTVDSLQGVEA